MFAAEDAPRRLEVVVGKTVEIDVGFAIGVRCDDLALIDVEMKSKETSNVLVVKGLREGTTQCRVGTNPGAASILFDVRVRSARR